MVYGYGAKYIWYEMVMVQHTYGTKLQFCGTKWYIMVRNGYGAKFIWYEMVSGYGTKLQFVVRNGKLWYEMAMVRNGYGTK